MKHVSLDTLDESVKRFVMSVAGEPGGSVLELNGEPVACIVHPPKSPNGKTHNDDWTESKNSRRCGLIEKKFKGGLDPQEAVELIHLQDEMLRYRQRVAPLPIEYARRLHQELLEIAAAKKSVS